MRSPAHTFLLLRLCGLNLHKSMLGFCKLRHRPAQIAEREQKHLEPQSNSRFAIELHHKPATLPVSKDPNPLRDATIRKPMKAAPADFVFETPPAKHSPD